MAGVLKKTTGLTGLAVVKHPHHVLGALYNKILRAVDKMPQDSAYRTYTEQIVKERADILQKNQDVKALETAIGCGQVEELIVQAENELMLVRKMIGYKPWESLIQEAPAGQWSWPPHK